MALYRQSGEVRPPAVPHAVCDLTLIIAAAVRAGPGPQVNRMSSPVVPAGVKPVRHLALTNPPAHQPRSLVASLLTIAIVRGAGHSNLPLQSEEFHSSSVTAAVGNWPPGIVAAVVHWLYRSCDSRDFVHYMQDSGRGQAHQRSGCHSRRWVHCPAGQQVWPLYFWMCITIIRVWAIMTLRNSWESSVKTVTW